VLPKQLCCSSGGLGEIVEGIPKEISMMGSIHNPRNVLPAHLAALSSGLLLRDSIRFFVVAVGGGTGD
jgi:hypothetical protein